LIQFVYADSKMGDGQSLGDNQLGIRGSRAQVLDSLAVIGCIQLTNRITSRQDGSNLVYKVARLRFGKDEIGFLRKVDFRSGTHSFSVKLEIVEDLLADLPAKLMKVGGLDVSQGDTTCPLERILLTFALDHGSAIRPIASDSAPFGKVHQLFNFSLKSTRA